MPSPIEEVERVFKLPALNFDPGQRYVHLIDQSCDVLGIERAAYKRLPPDEQEQLVSRSYKKLAAFTHPDKHSSDDAMRKKAENVFSSVGAAKEILLDALVNNYTAAIMAKPVTEETTLTTPAVKNKPTLWARFTKWVDPEGAAKKEQEKAERAAAEALEKKRVEEELAQRIITEAREKEVAEALAAENQRKAARAALEEEKRRRQKEVADAAERDRKTGDCVRAITGIRDNIFKLLGREKNQLNKIIQDLHKIFGTITSEQFNQLKKCLSFFFDDRGNNPKDFILKNQRSIDILEYREMQSKMDQLLNDLQLAALSDAIFTAIRTQFSSCFIMASSCPHWKPYDIPPTTYEAFLREFTKDETKSSSIAAYDQYVKIRPDVMMAITLFANLIRFYWAENSQMLIKFNQLIVQIVDLASDSMEKIRSSRTKDALSFPAQLVSTQSSLATLLFQLTQQFNPLAVSEKLSMERFSTREAANVVIIKAKLDTVLKNYTEYSQTYCRYSVFHRHGEAGRLRAAQFIESLREISSLKEMQQQLLSYLTEKKNGNTHPHSFRTLLLTEFVGPFPSKDFQLNLSKLEEQWTPSPLNANQV